MTMLTTCPNCSTTFRVTTEQLQAHNGKVRCGSCRQIFDAYKTLTTKEDNAVAADITSLTSTNLNIRAFTTPETKPAFKEMPTPVPVKKMPASVVELVLDIPALARKKPHKGWVAACVFLVLVLVLQGVYFFRNDIITRVPQTRMTFESVCAKLNCVVALPQQSHAISLDASDMQAIDPANPGVVKLTAVLHSHATMTVGYPALDVVLTDSSDHTVARRIFTPTEYLNNNQNLRNGIAPDAEATVQLALDIGDLNASGFRLDVLAAPH